MKCLILFSRKNKKKYLKSEKNLSAEKVLSSYEGSYVKISADNILKYFSYLFFPKK